jgi:hypothetical protein
MMDRIIVNDHSYTCIANQKLVGKYRQMIFLMIPKKNIQRLDIYNYDGKDAGKITKMKTME